LAGRSASDVALSVNLTEQNLPPLGLKGEPGVTVRGLSGFAGPRPAVLVTSTVAAGLAKAYI
jgi:hypothetical protein